MSSDIELGDDESITLACAQLRTRNTFGETQPIQVHGDLRVQNRVFLDAPPPIPKPAPPPAPPPSRFDFEPDERSPLDSRFSGSGRVVRISGGTAKPVEFGGTSGVTYKDVYSRLKHRPLPVDLWEELQLLREVVFDLHARLVEAEKRLR